MQTTFASETFEFIPNFQSCNQRLSVSELLYSIEAKAFYEEEQCSMSQYEPKKKLTAGGREFFSSEKCRHTKATTTNIIAPVKFSKRHAVLSEGSAYLRTNERKRFSAWLKPQSSGVQIVHGEKTFQNFIIFIFVDNIFYFGFHILKENNHEWH